jgi:hypothetical protein
LVITKPTSHNFDFSLLASAGANTGELKGKATITGSDRAHWRSSDPEFRNCALDFVRVLNRLNLGGHTDEISCGAGTGVDFSGTYVVSDKDPNIVPDLVALNVVPTPAMDIAIRELLGKDYGTMVRAANIISEGDNLDSNGAMVVNMSVRGTACLQDAVLMYDVKGHLWAAVFESLPSPPNMVEMRYYTNVPGDKNAMPRTIAAQREACQDDTLRVRVRMMR